MAKAPVTPAEQPAFDDARQYRTRLNKVVSVGRLKLYPLDEHEMPGKTLNAIVAEFGLGVIDHVDPIS